MHFRRKNKKSIEEVQREAVRAQASSMLRQLEVIEDLRIQNEIAEAKKLKEKNGQADSA
jgi:hypothetical protein